MPRFFVYVNTHNDRHHITLHAENYKACPHVFQHVKSGGIYSDAFNLTKLDSDTFKTGEKENSYWLIIWCSNFSGVSNNKHVLNATKEWNDPISICDVCK